MQIGADSSALIVFIDDFLFSLVIVIINNRRWC